LVGREDHRLTHGIAKEVDQVSQASTFSSTTEALDMLRAAMGFLAAADATAMPGELQAQCLLRLEEIDSVETAARASILGAFATGQGYAADAAYSARAWLVHKTRITRGGAAAHVKWARRAAAHPVVAAALAEAAVSESWARIICGLTDRLPTADRDQADAILLAAVLGGATLADLLGLGQTMYEMSRSNAPDPDGDPERAFEDRSVRLITTFQGAGVLTGDLTPECAAVVRKVLDALAAPTGAEDTRTQDQRYHDALQEAMRRLVAADLVPARAGQPSKVIALIALPDLIDLDAGSVLMAQWTARVRERWATARAAAQAIAAETGGGDGGVWLEGDAAQAFACDAGIQPVVMGEVHLAALDDLVRLCVELAGHRPGTCCQPCHPHDGDGSGHAAETVGQPCNQTDPGRDQTSTSQGTGAGEPAAGRRGSGPVPPTSAAARRWSKRSSARPPTCYRGRAGWPRSCAAGWPATGSPDPACPWTWGAALTSEVRSAPPSSSATSTAGSRELHPARLVLRDPPHHPPVPRRQDQRHRLHPHLLAPPPHHHPPRRLDPHPEPRRHLEQRPHQDPAQP